MVPQAEAICMLKGACERVVSKTLSSGPSTLVPKGLVTRPSDQAKRQPRHTPLGWGKQFVVRWAVTESRNSHECRSSVRPRGERKGRKENIRRALEAENVALAQTLEESEDVEFRTLGLCQRALSHSVIRDYLFITIPSFQVTHGRNDNNHYVT